MSKLNKEFLEQQIDEFGIHIGDIVEVMDESGESIQGVVINIEWHMFKPKLTYLIEFEHVLMTWYSRDDIKLIKSKSEKIIFT